MTCTTEVSIAQGAQPYERAPARGAGIDSEAGGELRVLTAAECVALLSAGQVGRVAVVTAARRPLIRPVNYVFDVASGSVVFRSRRGSKLYALAHADLACFEIDGGERDHAAPWSVIVTGRVELVGATAELERLQGLGLETWVEPEPTAWLRIRANVISGRRLVRG